MIVRGPMITVERLSGTLGPTVENLQELVAGRDWAEHGSVHPGHREHGPRRFRGSVGRLVGGEGGDAVLDLAREHHRDVLIGRRMVGLREGALEHRLGHLQPGGACWNRGLSRSAHRRARTSPAAATASQRHREYGRCRRPHPSEATRMDARAC
jgi:hypothetical protein